MIAANGVALAYGGCRILEDVALDVAEGELLALVGPNGAGKSTLLRALAGLHALDAGRVTIEGRDVATLSASERGRLTALVEAEGSVPSGMRVVDVVGMGRLPYRPWWRWSTTDRDRDACERAVARTGLAAFASRPFEELSTGERQRVWIALAVAQNARMLLLDEPTSHLDIRYAFETLSLVRSLVDEGRGAVVVLHDLNLAAAFADRIALLGERRLLACGAPAGVLDPALLSRAYGIPLAVRRTADGSVVTFAERAVRGR